MTNYENFLNILKNVFSQGISNVVIIATHVTFVLLKILILGMFFLTKSYHFLVLFLISLIFYILLTWFISETKKLNEQKKTE